MKIWRQQSHSLRLFDNTRRNGENSEEQIAAERPVTSLTNQRRIGFDRFKNFESSANW
ncbi:hypothetical protein T01_9214 [Trichinella spiralis]|uniref:Uncharacterized protein n=1 Tax=Trichinella spiralis TaxID=6334 RepID=A0A0V1AX89_TRISP|nr:hypothetical protein T01_9214 [Trichinella spiralis]